MKNKNKELIKKLKNERDELKYRLDKLTLFLDEQRKEQTVSDRQLVLLNRQWLLMCGYLSILDWRINDLEEQHD